MQSNFRNNQNYILWKSEKKKLLWKFFWESSLNRIFYYISYVRHNILVWIIYFLYFLLYFIISYLIWITILSLLNLFNSVNWVLLVSIFSFFISIYASYNSNKRKIFKIKYINYFKDYFFIRWRYKNIWKNNLHIIFADWQIGLIEILINWIITFFIFIKLLIIYIYYINIFSFSIWLILLVFFIIYVNIILTIISPLVFLYIWLTYLYWFIYTFLIKRLSWYNFIKKVPEQNILKKFKTLNNTWAENDIYKIKVRV